MRLHWLQHLRLPHSKYNRPRSVERIKNSGKLDEAIDSARIVTLWRKLNPGLRYAEMAYSIIPIQPTLTCIILAVIDVGEESLEANDAPTNVASSYGRPSSFAVAPGVVSCDVKVCMYCCTKFSRVIEMFYCGKNFSTCSYYTTVSSFKIVQRSTTNSLLLFL
jgi:hypothetical protein